MGPNSKAPFMGYPDMGAGVYARLLPYKEWYEFNCAQRVHANSVEHMAWVTPLGLMSAVFFPRVVTGLGAVVLIGRELYRFGYTSADGPNSKIREMGAIPLNVAELLLVLGLGFAVIRF